jgi:trehalose-6-phosphatase
VVVNKGTAIVDLVAEHRLRGVVFLGDDLTDVDGFVALRALREAGEVDALSVGVLGAETPPRVRESVDVAVRSVPACAALLAAVADRLEAEAVGMDASAAGDAG